MSQAADFIAIGYRLAEMSDILKDSWCGLSDDTYGVSDIEEIPMFGITVYEFYDDSILVIRGRDTHTFDDGHQYQQWYVSLKL